MFPVENDDLPFWNKKGIEKHISGKYEGIQSCCEYFEWLNS